MLETHGYVQSYLLFELKNELPRSSPAALSLKDTLLVQQHPLQGLRRRRLLGRAVLGHLLHQDIVTGVGVGQDAVGILGLGQSLGRTHTGLGHRLSSELLTFVQKEMALLGQFLTISDASKLKIGFQKLYFNQECEGRMAFYNRMKCGC